MWIANRIKEKKRAEVGNNETKFEVKSIKLYFWIMVVSFLLWSCGFVMCYLDGQLDWVLGLGFGAFVIGSFIGVLATSLWRVRVDGNDIEFRSTLRK